MTNFVTLIPISVLQIALRWRIEKEVVAGKGQFICGNKVCNAKEDLKTWEVNFAYAEQGEKKNALVKLSKQRSLQYPKVMLK
jgi:Folate-sensitive fragile site protein Fra10Ac1